jgi:chlorobactene glucosyltransferase
LMEALWVEHQVGVCVFLLVLVFIALWNLRVLTKPAGARSPDRWPRVSILLPARDEERSIVEAVESLAGQDYADFELVVLDDCSSDRTPDLLRQLAERFDNLRVVEGKPLPRGWMGKLWACDQLSREATGELLLFTDADTRHRPETLQQSVARFQEDGLDLLTGIPYEETVTWAEKLVLPVLPWAILSFLPLGLAYRWRRPSFTAANGQFMLFRRESYDSIGGHAMVRDSVVDDMALVRLVAKQGMKWRLFDMTDLIRCRMYRSAREVFDGLSKNLFGIFGYRLVPFLFVWIWLGVVFFGPLVVLGLAAFGVVTSAFSVVAAGCAVLLGLVLWGMANTKFRFGWWVSLLYPATVMLSIAIAFRSLVLVASRQARWKGRGAVIRRVKLW